MPRFYSYEELVGFAPAPLDEISRLAARISDLDPFRQGFAVLCGSVAWGRPSWRSDIDVAVFSTESFPDIASAIGEITAKGSNGRSAQYLIPRVDTIYIGAESQQLVTRDNLVRGSAPITQMQTVREIFVAAGLRFSNHIGALAAVKGQPWRNFYTTYLSQLTHGRQQRRDGIRDYVSSFADDWRQGPRDAEVVESFPQDQLNRMGYIENFPNHLLRQILAERGKYPSPDRAADVRVAFNALSDTWAKQLVDCLEPFLRVAPEYAALVEACRGARPISSSEYRDRLIRLFARISFDDVEEAVWTYLRETS